MTEDYHEFSGALVLIVEDEGTQRMLTRDCLEEAGFQVAETVNGEDCISKIHALRPDLVLLDVMLPGIDGFEVCRQIRDDPMVGRTPVVLITGRDNINDVKRGFTAGATDFFAKPVRWNLLPTRIDFVLRTSRLENDLRLSKEAAEKANAAKSNLLSTMGHELRTPLNAIIGFSEMIKEHVYGPVGDPRYEAFVEDIHASGSQLLKGINDVLEIVNTESLEIKPGGRQVSISDIVNKVVAAAQPVAAAEDISIVNDCPAAAIEIHGDTARLHHALSNIVSNAVKFSRPGGTVRIDTSRSSDNGVTLSVSDDGIGIHAEDIERVMEPFEQADNTLTRVYEGMGLGLPLSRAYIRLHGGELTLASELDKGTVVTIKLPPDQIADGDDDAPKSSQYSE